MLAEADGSGGAGLGDLGGEDGAAGAVRGQLDLGPGEALPEQRQRRGAGALGHVAGMDARQVPRLLRERAVGGREGL